jgi:capsular exopolysaccharide synthesis family protein
VDLKRHLRLAGRWVVLAVVGAVAAGLIAYALLSSQARVYEASATLKVGQVLTGDPIIITTVSDRLLTEYAYRATTSTTIEEVIAELGLELSASDLLGRVTTRVEPGSTLLAVNVRAAGEPETAAELANAISERLIDISTSANAGNPVQQTLRENVDTLRDQIEGTRARIAELSEVVNPTQQVRDELAELDQRLVDLLATHGAEIERLNATGAHSLRFVSRATTPEAPVEPRVLLFTLLAVFTGLLIATAVAGALEYFDDTLRYPSDLEGATGLPMLGNLVESARDVARGADNRLITVIHPRSDAAEAYRRLRAGVEVASQGERIQSLLLTGSEPAMGIQVTAANLAVAFAESGLRVTLIDGDLRNPAIHAIFRLPNTHGLATALEYDNVVIDRISARTRVPNLQVITSGNVAGNPARALSSTRLRSLLVQLHGRAELVIIAGPPLPSVSDALVLGAELRNAMVVVTRGKTRRGAVHQAIDALGIAHVDVVGTVYYSRQRGRGTRGSRVPDDAAAPEKSGEEALERGQSA